VDGMPPLSRMQVVAAREADGGVVAAVVACAVAACAVAAYSVGERMRRQRCRALRVARNTARRSNYWPWTTCSCCCPRTGGQWTLRWPAPPWS